MPDNKVYIRTTPIIHECTLDPVDSSYALAISQDHRTVLSEYVSEQARIMAETINQQLLAQLYEEYKRTTIFSELVTVIKPEPNTSYLHRKIIK